MFLTTSLAKRAIFQRRTSWNVGKITFLPRLQGSPQANIKAERVGVVCDHINWFPSPIKVKLTMKAEGAALPKGPGENTASEVVKKKIFIVNFQIYSHHISARLLMCSLFNNSRLRWWWPFVLGLGIPRLIPPSPPLPLPPYLATDVSSQPAYDTEWPRLSQMPWERMWSCLSTTGHTWEPKREIERLEQQQKNF